MTTSRICYIGTVLKLAGLIAKPIPTRNQLHQGTEDQRAIPVDAAERYVGQPGHMCSGLIRWIIELRV